MNAVHSEIRLTQRACKAVRQDRVVIDNRHETICGPDRRPSVGIQQGDLETEAVNGAQTPNHADDHHARDEREQQPRKPCGDRDAGDQPGPLRVERDLAPETLSAMVSFCSGALPARSRR